MLAVEFILVLFFIVNAIILLTNTMASLYIPKKGKVGELTARFQGKRAKGGGGGGGEQIYNNTYI